MWPPRTVGFGGFRVFSDVILQVKVKNLRG